MKIQSLLGEADVIDITDANKDDRKYGADGYKSLASSLSGEQTFPVADTPPLLKPSKQFRYSSFEKNLASVGFTLPEGSTLQVTTNIHSKEPNVSISLFLGAHEMAPELRQRWQANMLTRLGEALAKLFGTYAAGIKLFRSYAIVYLSQSYMDAINVERKPIVSEMIAAILRKQNIGGLNFIYITRTKSGYTVKVEGAELVDAKSLRTLKMALTKTFGDTFIDLKHDGIISDIGNRLAPEGVTNYRLYFKHDLKDGRILSN